MRGAPFFLLALSIAGCPGPTPDADDTGATGDSGRDAPVPTVAPIFRNSVAMADMALAREALRLMGSPEVGGMGSCHACHGLTRESVRHMRDLSDAAETRCFTNLNPRTTAEASEIVDCFLEGMTFSASRMGIYSTGGRNAWFRYVFDRAERSDEYDDFLMRGAMPNEGTPFTQAEFDLVTEWFLRGTPFADTILPGVEPGTCTTNVTGSVRSIVDDSRTNSWATRNAAAGILMHGCGGATNPRDCLASYPLASDRPIGAGWSVVPGSRARILFETTYASSFWTRISADGRYVAHGGGSSAGASVIDLMRGVVIGADASFDPGFFPDNSGIIFQGASAGGTVICRQSVLMSATSLSFTEPGCTSAIDIALYQHMGASLDGGDYWAVTSGWSGDNGGNGADPTLFVDAGSSVTMIAMRNTGTGFTGGDRTTVATPNEASAILSPAARTMVTQIADASSMPLGYVLRRVDVSTDAMGRRTIALPEIGRYCYPGGKPAISFDERFLVTHHRATDADAVELGFTGPTDPGFAAYRGVSNIYLIDLTTGMRTLVTRMAPDQQALFPHFRSDGWIYYMVKTDRGGGEYVVATDAALVLAGG